MATTIDGNTGNQPWISRGAALRANNQFMGSVTFIALVLCAVMLGALIYVASIPRQLPVPFNVNKDGSYSIREVNTSPTDVERQHMLVNWIGACRMGSSDPHSFPSNVCSGMLLKGTQPFKDAQAFNQVVADKNLKVTPTVRRIDGSGKMFVIDWDESVVASHDDHFIRAMRGYITIGFSQDLVALNVDPLMNPYGEFVTDMRTVEIH